MNPVKHTLILTSLLLIASSAAEVRAEGNAETGRLLAYTCMGCHGIEGYRNAYPSYHVPKLGGQKPEYIESALRSYRDGNRDHPTMNAQGMSLTEDDIEHLSAWFGQEPAVSGVADKASIAGLDAAATCIECHGASPSGATPDTPVLAGQYEDYLIEAIDQYRDGSRSGSVMPGFVASLDDDDIEAIADFYASQDGLDTLDEDD